ncbi:inositol 5-phosphatase-like protein [Trypanosoma theileri]|uniref:Inositol 5-phosphatase-like protein n=1 Tax=Trypanosoma theileri TaxID=67003 RepID=A0A1X0PAQ8_9TRYP|nr:inositol 5-phosphatase-like protein [Trypanosoma theileri]ORC93540.1 inositol 5-phosphatase-like protein [Trypanosoma theileri]
MQPMVRYPKQGCDNSSGCNDRDSHNNVKEEKPVKLAKSRETRNIVKKIFHYIISLFSAVYYFLRDFFKFCFRFNSRARYDSSNDTLHKKDDDLSTKQCEEEEKKKRKNLGRTIVQDISSLLHLNTSNTEDDSKDDSMTSGTIQNDAVQRRSFANTLIRRRLELEKPESLRTTFRVHACTWNVDQTPPPESCQDICEWLLGKSLMGKLKAYHAAKANYEKIGKGTPPVVPIADFPDLVVVSLQEVEMGGVVLVKEYTETGVSWAETIVEALNKASDHKLWYRKLKMVQLVGLVLIVVLRVEHSKYVMNVRASLTRTGAMRGVWGNKGSVGLRATIYGKRFLLIAAHFVAHKHNERTRTFNYHASLSDLRFEAQVDVDDETEVLQMFSTLASESEMIRGVIGNHSTWARLFGNFRRNPSAGIERRVLDKHDYVFFLGDLNSRLHGVKSADIRRLVRCKDYDHLICCDELRQGMISGDTFDGFQEPIIDFPPTYKFDHGTDLYDTSYKKRDPAWCDRILFRVCLPCEDSVGYSLDEERTNNSTTRNSSRSSGGGSNTSSSGNSSSSNSSICFSCNCNSKNGRNCCNGEDKNKKLLSDSNKNSTNDKQETPCTTSTKFPLSHVYEPLHKSAEDVKDEAESSTSSSRSSEVLLEGKRSISVRGEIPPTHLFGSLSSMDTTEPSTSKTKSPPVDIVAAEAKQLPTFFSARRSTCTDRRLLIFPMVPNRVSVLDYHHIPDMRQSDHRPVCAQFDVDVLSLEKDLVDEVMHDVYEGLSHDYAYYIT